MERDSRPIALGTWNDRYSAPPELPEDAFGPTDTMPLSMFSPSGKSRSQTHQEGERDAERSLVALAEHALSAYRSRKKEEEAFLKERASAPRWSVTGGSVAIHRYLNKVSEYCLGLTPFDDAAQARLSTVAPVLTEPTLRLVAEQRRLHAAPLMKNRHEAGSLMRPALRAAQEVQALVASSFRPIPRPARMPTTGVFFTRAWKNRALERAVEEHDRIIALWYRFVFTDPVPTGLVRRLETLGDELTLRPQAWRCVQDRQVCLDMAAAPAVSGLLIVESIRSLETALHDFEEAAYSALTRDS